MKIEDFKARAEAAGAQFMGANKVNTNNGWGFGGRFGTDYVFRAPGEALFVLQTGELSYRHRGTERIKPRVSVSGIYKPFTAKLFLELFEKGGIQAIREYPDNQQKG